MKFRILSSTIDEYEVNTYLYISDINKEYIALNNVQYKVVNIGCNILLKSNKGLIILQYVRE